LTTLGGCGQIPDVTERQTASFAWPGGARAAVSLTYDDAVGTQRGNAARQLGERGLTGTFFLTGTSPDLAARRREWQNMLGAGHELGSHTMHHPCDGSHAWVPRGYTTQDYDLPRMEAELDETLKLLVGLGASPPFTFAYPCGETRVGKEPQSYVRLVAQRFLAARSTEPRIADPVKDNLELVPAHDGARTPAELIALVDQAEATGGWLVLLFHGVGGDHLAVRLDAHAALLDHLSRRRGTIWTERFGAVAAHVQSRRELAGGGPSGMSAQ
jgi:peptidoglycan/xylan/chitin deacetylase (PgdA/CDA1 family)